MKRGTGSRTPRRIGWTAILVMTALVFPLASVATADGRDDNAVASDFDPHDFPREVRIHNHWVPLIPGTRLVLQGRSNLGGGLVSHQVITTVTDLTKMIDGVRTAVVWDQDISEGKLVESELAFEAQDRDGNVWNLGEYPEEYDDTGKFEGAPSTWIAGLRGAKPGILMRDEPRVGTSAYSEGRALEVDFWDKAKVFETGGRVCVTLRCFDNVLVIDEWSPLAPEDGHQRKYYAAGVGNVFVRPVGGQEQETLELVDLEHLGSKALADVREAALRLDKRGHTVSKVYGQTPPVERRRHDDDDD